MNVKTLATQIWPSALVLLLPFQVSAPGTPSPAAALAARAASDYSA